jgi:Fe-Mn family superoxide dismutase
MPKFELPPLPYDYAALEPHIDAQTMQIHHDKHHAAYVKNLNAALEIYPDLQTKSGETLLRELNSLPEAVRTAVRNQGGGVVNHAMFWQIMAPNAGGEPTGDLANALKAAFGNFAGFKDHFTKAAMGQFGSGWAWLVRDGAGALKIMNLPNQNSPLTDGQTPILCVDVWEHAYYLKYQNRRADYLTAWWNVVNWAAVAERYAKAKK